MRGVVYHGPGDVRVEPDLPMPTVRGPRDAVVRVTRTAICGTDLHPYRGEIPGFESGTVLGHEFTGTLVDAGAEVSLHAGQRVVASDIVACGRCERCARGEHYQCELVTLFGYSTVVGTALPGGQAEYVRVPYADVVLAAVPDDLTDEEALFAGDILSTGYAAIQATAMLPGQVVAVVGGGPVGLCAAMCAIAAGAARVVVTDLDQERRERANRLGFTASSPAGLSAALARAGAPDGAPAVVEAVGTDAALAAAVRAARPCATIAIVGAHHAPDLPFPAGTAFARELTVRFVVGDPIRHRDQVLALVRADRLDPAALVSHRMPLSAAAEAYRLFDRREAFKVVLDASG
ncbi:alcohol dehydrogenase [Amycolatopsis sp. WAC 01376]|uniref:alcohol dehydrogenase catalytic domain-containing protein n=1 Tax=Amycolatopsis sp. WAC 01376 TaxID=2203195 RepID=UPI000F7A93AA|nr:alcohol dehydrogenase catalytic domain-containing protein [Amycolatopsis sp. WAC 01376]RSM56220.1 alcohol dehydrogenase [Amycolatopsis sp. WAC 01376]